MANTKEYTQALLGLLPQGKAWAAQTPATWDERVPVYDNGDPISGREATIIGENVLSGFKALLLGLAQTAGLPANATAEDVMAAAMQR